MTAMSRTDKTAPYYVKWFYEKEYLQPQHHHENGVCDLPPKPLIRECSGTQFWWSGTRCQWWPTFAFYRSRDARCPCYMCSKHAYGRDPNKKRRQAEKKYCKGGWREEY